MAGLRIKKKITAADIENFTAIHESGHALIGWYFGLTLYLVSIQPGKHEGIEVSGICKSMFLDSSRVESVTHRLFTTPRVYELMAGRCATDILIPSIPHGHGHSHDFKLIENLNEIDSTVLSMHNWRLQNKKIDVELFYQRFCTPVLRIIKSKRGQRSIKALSRALINCRQLSGCEAARILEKSWGKPMPSYALPAEEHKSIVETGPQSFNDLMNKILLYVKILKEEILSLRDDSRNSKLQNNVIDQISKELLLIQLLALGP
jgi:hypothetical protein